jgi:ABC-type transport system involved in cytochrome c biogenesis permease subunit
MMGQGNPQITHLMPVLQSPLLSLHVCIIMVSYSLVAFTFLTGIAALLSRREAFMEQLADVSRMLLYPALFCMAAGIFLGAIWANVSWGRYWGWDPKEVWALITFLVYAFALHTETLPIFRKSRFFHIFMVTAFLTVLMTYFGVNFILGGLHSYATT